MEKIFISMALAHGDVIDEHPEEDVAAIDPVYAGLVVVGAILIGYSLWKLLKK